MRSRRFCFVLLFAACLAWPVLSQSATPPSAQAFAAVIDKHYNALRALSVQFTQQYDGMGMHRTEAGTLLLKRSGKLVPGSGQMRWTYAEPEGKLFVLDGHHAYFYTPGQTEIPRVAAKQLDDMRSPLALLLGHAELAKQLSGPALSRSGDGDWTLTGIPRGMEQRVASLAVTATADGRITAMRVEETDGAVNLFRFAAEQANPRVGPGAFVFVPPPGTHTVDGLPPV